MSTRKDLISIRINSALYPVLLEKGGDRLIAFYVHLKSVKTRRRIMPVITQSGRKIKHLNLLKKVTGFSRKTCEKYFKMLIEMNLANFSKDGAVYLMGENTIKKHYSHAQRVPVKIGETLLETALNSYFVRVYAMEKKQKTVIQEIQSQHQLIARVSDGIHVSSKLYETYKAIVKNEKKMSKLDTWKDDKVVLSRMGFAKLKDNSKDNVSKGRYWRDKLKKANLIRVRRNNIPLMACTEVDFKYMKRETPNFRLNWRNGMMYEETCAEFTTSTFPIKPTVKVERPREVKVKPLSYLSFDFIAWCANS